MDITRDVMRMHASATPLAQIRGEMPMKGEGLQARLGKLGDK